MSARLDGSFLAAYLECQYSKFDSNFLLIWSILVFHRPFKSPSATIRRSISLFILSLNSSEPYSRAFNRDSPSKLITGRSIKGRHVQGRHGDYVFH